MPMDGPDLKAVMLKQLLLVSSLACCAVAQSFVATGIAVPSQGKALHNISSWICGAVNIGKDIYSYSCYDTALVAGTLHVTTVTGLAQHLRDYGPRVHIYIFGNAGATQTGTALTSAYSAGGIGVISLRGKMNLVVTGQYGKTSGPAVRLGLGWSF